MRILLALVACLLLGPSIALAQSGNPALVPVEVTGSWTPNDQSGAGLAFTSVSGEYSRQGSIVIVGGTLTFPSTANGANATIGGLPFTIPNSNQNQTNCLVSTSGAFDVALFVKNTTTFSIFTTAGAHVVNSGLTLNAISFVCTYSIT